VPGGRGKGRGSFGSPDADESTSYETNMGKWARQGLSAVHSRFFWLITATSNRISEELDQILWACQANANWKVGSPSNLAKLVWEHAARIEQNLEGLLTSDVWGKMAEFLEAEDNAIQLQTAFTDAVVRLLLRVNADYARRVMRRLRDFPYEILWIGRASPAIKCPERLRVATKLLQTPDKELPSTTRTIASLEQGCNLRVGIVTQK
jgi:hypothetical protein